MTKPHSTEIVFVLDRSGSMQSVAADMCGGFDAFIAKQRAVQGECRVTLTQFDTYYETVYMGVPVHAVQPLKLEPRGGTALMDAIGRAIGETGRRLASMREEDRPSQVLFVIITDGLENASREFRRAQIHSMISHQREKYAWEFVFLGANVDALEEAKTMGISMFNAVSYDASAIGANAMFATASAGVAMYRNAGVAQMDCLVTQEAYAAAVAAVPAPVVVQVPVTPAAPVKP